MKILEDSITVDGHILHRIQADRDIPFHGVKVGDVGGWIEKRENLQGEAWVDDDAMVYDDAVVTGNAFVCHNATTARLLTAMLLFVVLLSSHVMQ